MLSGIISLCELLIVRVRFISTDQLICNLIHDVGIIKSSPLVLPPALDVDTRFLLKVRQMEVVSGNFKHNLKLFCFHYCLFLLTYCKVTPDLSVMTGFMRGVVETETRSPSSSASSSLEFRISSFSSSSFSPSFFFFLAAGDLLTPSIWLP